MFKHKFIVLSVLALFFGGSLGFAPAAFAWDATEQIKTYSGIVYQTYRDSLRMAEELEEAVEDLLEEPTEVNFSKAKEAWLASRVPYGQSEVFRFYEGPIDFVDEEKGLEGPEGLLNAWPLDEAYIDYVEGNPTSGIINDPSIPLTEESLEEKNQVDDEAEVSTGYHAVEFLLWGQDLSAEGPGSRPVSDYAQGDPVKERRREYLEEVTELLLVNLSFLVEQWEPGKEDNYAAKFQAMDQKETVGKIFTAMATLSGFELGSERMATALDSGDQEDEHSCFSDNTHEDFILNLKGIKNVYFGQYEGIKGKGFGSLVAEVNPELDSQIKAKIAEAEKLIGSLDKPIDQKILATPQGSPARKKMETAVQAFYDLAKLLEATGPALGVTVEIQSE